MHFLVHRLPAGLALALVLAAQSPAATAQPGPAASAASAASAEADGEVRRIDKAQGTVTLRHGPLTDLGMPGMTMVFKAADPALLDPLKEGERVRFRATRVNGTLTVTAISAAP